MNKSIFTIVLSLILIFLNIEVNAQQNIIIVLKMPPPGTLNVSDFWNITVTNNSGGELSGYLVGTAKEDKDGMIAKGTTVPVTLKRGINNIKIKDLPKTPDVEYIASDPRYKESLIRQGKFPSGNYEICVKLISASTNEELGSDCINQEVFETGLLTILNPADGEEIDNKIPITFSWSSGGKAPAGEYILKICEVMKNQTPEIAMKSNRAFFEEKGINSTRFTYPNSAKVFEEGKKYAWMISNGNTGSEVWTFKMTSSTCSDIGIDSLFITCDDDSNKVYDYRIKLTNHCPNNSVSLMGVFVTTSGYGAGTVSLPPTLPIVSGLFITVNPNLPIILASGGSIWVTGTINAISMAGGNFEFFIWSQSPTFGKAYDFKDTTLMNCGEDCCQGLFQSINTGDVVISNGQVFTQSGFVISRPIMKITADIVSCYSTPVGSGCSGSAQPVSCKITSASMINFSSLIPYSGEGIIYNNPGIDLTNGYPLNLTINFSSLNLQCREILKFCIRYTFTDTNCRSCDTVICYNVNRPSSSNDIQNEIENNTTGYSGGWSFPFFVSNETDSPAFISSAGYSVNADLKSSDIQNNFITSDCPDIDPMIITDFVKNPNDSLCPIEETSNGGSHFVSCLSACENSYVSYTTTNDPGSAWTWTLTGSGTITSGQGTNSITVLWGSIGNGTVKVVQTSSSNCTESDEVCVKIIEKPIALFTPSSVNICEGQTVYFTNNSINTLSQHWSFGDGSGSTDFNTSHKFNTHGSYWVTLNVNNFCGCTDIDSILITVNPGNGPVIECPSTVCANTTGCYSTSANCSSYNWSVQGGTIQSGQGTNSICVEWGDGNSGNGVITLDVSGCNPAYSCTSPAVAVVPIVPTNPIISGDNVVCANEVTSYSLPSIPGTYYTWSVTGGYIHHGQYTNEIFVNWNAFGQASVSVTIHNILFDCGGSGSILVNIKPKLEIFGPEDGCAGTSYTYYASGNCDWTITDGNISLSANNVQNVSVTWTSATGPYQIKANPTTATASNFCNSNPLIIDVNVIAVPAATSITGPTAVCTGNNYTYTAALSDPNSGVIWSISPPTAGSIIGSVNANPVTVKWTGSGDISVSQISTNSLSCISQPILLHVDPVILPAAITGNIDPCVDGQEVYSVVIPNQFVNCEWTISPPELGSILTGQGGSQVTVRWNGSTTGLNNATVSVNVCGAALLLPVTIQRLVPTININTVSCNTTLSTQSYTSYEWFEGANNIGSTQSIPITHSGTYLLKVTDVNGCTGENTIVAVVPSAPVVKIVTKDFTSFCPVGASIDVKLEAVVIPFGNYTYQWFNNGPPIGTNNASFQANSVGSYTVQVTDGNGCTAISLPITISTNDCPNPTICTDQTFTANINEGSGTHCNEINFSIGSHSNFNSPYTWDFGDGQPGSGDPVTHTYNEAGYYHVKLCSSVPTGICPQCVTKVITVPLAADFDAQISCDQLTVTDKTTFMPGVSGTLSWSFQPPGGSYSNFTGPLTMNIPGTYDIKLIVTNNATGCTSEKIKSFTYSPPAAPSITTNVGIACTDVPVHFNTPAGMFSYLWDFGDGSTSFVSNPDHVYTAGATGLTIKLTVVDNNGCSSFSTSTINVIAPLPSLPNPDVIICEDQLPYTLTSPFGTTWQWYKDNVIINLATSQNLIIDANTVNPNGNYTVLVTGFCPVMTLPITLVVNPLPKAIITPSINTNICIKPNPYNPNDPNLSKNILFTGYNGGGYTFKWEVFSGTNNTSINTSTANPFSYTFNSTLSSSYTVKLTVTDPITHCTNTSSWPVNFYSNPDKPYITASPFPPCEGTLVTLTANLISPISNAVFVWNTGQTGPTISVSSAGNYNVTVFDPNGCSSTSFPYILHPKPDISLFPMGCDTLCDTTNIPGPKPPDNEYYSYEWFLDGVSVSTSRELDIPLQSGDYTLTMTSTYGCTSTAGPYHVTAIDCDNIIVPSEVPTCCENRTQIKSSSLDYIIDDNHELNFSFLTSPAPIKKVIVTILGSAVTNSSCGLNGEMSSYFYGTGNITGPVTGLSGPVIPASNLFSKEVIWGSNSGAAVDLSTLSSAKLLIKIPIFLQCVDDLKLDIKYTFEDSSCVICDTVITYIKHRNGNFTPWSRLNYSFGIDNKNPVNVGLNDVRSKLKNSDIGKSIEQWYTALSATNWVEKLVENNENVEVAKSMLKIGKRIIVDGGKFQKEDISVIEKTLNIIQNLGIKAPDNLIEKVIKRLDKCVGMGWNEAIDKSLMTNSEKDTDKKKNDMNQKNDNIKSK